MKARRISRARRPDVAEHVDQYGKPKKRLRPQHAKALAGRTGMNAYHCGTCGAWHVGHGGGS